MKIEKSSLISLFLLQVLLLTSATNAFAYSQRSLDLDSRLGEFFKADQNTRAVLFEESVSEGYLQNSPENENDSFKIHSNLKFDYFRIEFDSENQLTSDFQPNGRRILKIQIFPFHFFW